MGSPLQHSRLQGDPAPPPTSDDWKLTASTLIILGETDVEREFDLFLPERDESPSVARPNLLQPDDNAAFAAEVAAPCPGPSRLPPQSRTKVLEIPDAPRVMAEVVTFSASTSEVSAVSATRVATPSVSTEPEVASKATVLPALAVFVTWVAVVAIAGVAFLAEGPQVTPKSVIAAPPPDPPVVVQTHRTEDIRLGSDSEKKPSRRR